MKDLTAVMLFSLINVLALFHPIATLIWTQMLPAPLQEAEHTSWGWNITFQNSQEPKNSLHVFFLLNYLTSLKYIKIENYNTIKTANCSIRSRNTVCHFHLNSLNLLAVSKIKT